MNKQSYDTNKSPLKNLAKQHKKLLRKEKRKHDKALNAKLRTLKSTNPGEYWRIINHGKKELELAIFHLTYFKIILKY